MGAGQSAVKAAGDPTAAREPGRAAGDPAHCREQDRDTGQTAADPARRRERDEKIIIGAGPSGAKKRLRCSEAQKPPIFRHDFFGVACLLEKGDAMAIWRTTEQGAGQYARKFV